MYGKECQAGHGPWVTSCPSSPKLKFAFKNRKHSPALCGVFPAAAYLAPVAHKSVTLMLSQRRLVRRRVGALFQAPAPLPANVSQSLLGAPYAVFFPIGVRRKYLQGCVLRLRQIEPSPASPNKPQRRHFEGAPRRPTICRPLVGGSSEHIAAR